MHDATEASISILDRLVSFNTVSDRSNLELVDYVCGYLAGHGVATKIIKDASGKKANIFATIGDAGQKGHVLSAHTDVVPVTGQSWAADPFQLVRRGDRLVGRGTADMKGFVACVLAMVPDLVNPSCVSEHQHFTAVS